MAKKINIKTIRIVLITVLALLVVLLSIFPLVLNLKPRSSSIKEVNPSWTPVDYAYPSYFDRNELESGSSWRINENAMFELETEDGTFLVSESGDVYQVAEDGSLSTVNDNEILEKVKDDIEAAKEQNPDAGLYIPELPIKDEIPEEIMAALAKTIENTGIPLEDLLVAIEDAGLTPKQYLEGYNTMQDNSKDTPSELPTRNEQQNSESISTRFVNNSPLSISLGGSASSVNEKEEQYQQTIQSNGLPNPAELANAMRGVYSTESNYVQQNDQSGKQSFMNSFSGISGSDYLTKNDIRPTTVISMILITGINTDLPGQIIAEVTQNVYDSLTGSVLLIPKGTRLTGTYSSSISFGQERALIAWTQLIRPDGFMLSLPGLPGIDGQGYAGYSDKVDTHFWDLVWYSGLSSLIDLGAGYLSEEASIAGNDAFSTVADAYIKTVSTAGQELMENHINRQPTITIRPGTHIKLFVSEKLTLPEYKL